ncbi:MAG: tetratricopeptide repeat protein [Eubacteriales bacterium]|nr:tetratricopeptide repeat protein [Eubacteriales bacterium]
MNCIYCGTPLAGVDYCTGCGADVTLQKRIIRISNLLYNEGLEKATVRDLSGAIVCLKRSLKFNKENIAARNLLGLVYFETGEVVAALSEWVISKNMNVPGNAADLYIARLQANKNKLDAINQTIRKYNQALLYCRQGNEDMAVIQLKKVLSQNPKLIKAYHLLALLYLRRQEYEKARKLLKKAAYIDATNTTTLRYLQEVEAATGISTSLDVKRRKKYAKDEKVNRLTGTTTYMSGNEMIIQPTTFRDSSALATFINIGLGLLLGGAIVWFLVVPATRQSIYAEANKQVTDANSKMAAEVTKVQGLEDEIAEYQAKVDEANNTMEEAQKKADSYDDLLEASRLFISGDQTAAATALDKVDAASLDGEGEKLYEAILANVQTLMFNNYRNAGDIAYVAGNYTTAAENYERATQANPDDYETLQLLGMSYYYLGDTDNSDAVFKEFIQKFPAQSYLVEAYIVNQSATARNSSETDADGNPVQETDENGNPVAETDEYGNVIQETDENGNPVPETDENGNPVETTEGE